MIIALLLALVFIIAALTVAGFVIKPLKYAPGQDRERMSMRGYREFSRSAKIATILIIASITAIPAAVAIAIVTNHVTSPPETPATPISVTRTSFEIEDGAYAEGVTPDGQAVLLSGVYQKGTTANLYPKETDASLGQTVYAPHSLDVNVILGVPMIVAILAALLYVFLGDSQRTATKYALILRGAHRRMHPRRYKTAEIVQAALD